MMKKRLIVCGLSLFLFLFTAYSIDLKSITNPVVINYRRPEYKASSQNWAITQGSDNIMWFGNIGKILWFDGEEWGDVDIPNSSIVRSLLKLNDSTILAGAFAEFGSIKKDHFGNYSYTSWLDKIPEKYHDFTDIWKIQELNNTVYIQSYEYVFIFRNNEFAGVFQTQSQFMFSFISNGRLYVEELGAGLKVLLNSELLPFEKGDFFKGKSIWFVGHSTGRLIVGTQNNGIYIFQNGTWNQWNTGLNRELSEHALFCGLQISKNKFLFGTVRNGILLVDEKGNIEKRINIENGLQNNTVLTAFLDAEKNIWLGLDKGIDYIKVNFQFSNLSSADGIGTGYASVIYKNQLYLGTSQGVFRWSDLQRKFQIIENTAGQVWSFKEINDKLYCCHNNGIYLISGNTAELVLNIGGTWKILKVPGHENLYISGNYTGMHLISFGKTAEFWPISDFDESCRIFEFDQKGEIWMSHGYKGVYNLKLSEDLHKVISATYFGKNQGLPADTRNEVFKYKDQIFVAAIDGFYHYNANIGLMQANTIWNEMINVVHPVSKVFVDKWNRISFFNGGKITMVILENDTIKYLDSTSFLSLSNNLFNAFENITFVSQDQAIIGTIDGFQVYNRDQQFNQPEKVKLFIKRLYCIQGKSGTILETELPIDSKKIKVPYNKNNLRIILASPVFQNHDYLEVKYSINNQDEILLGDDNVIRIQGLNEINNVIKISARDRASNISSEDVLLDITILPPWYKRWYSYIVYLCLLLILLTGFLMILRRYFNKIRRTEQINQKRKMIQQQIKLQQQAEQAEKQLIIMKNEKLALENRTKAEEIANSTMELVHKNKMLLDVKETLKIIQKETNLDNRNSTIKGILKKIDRDLNNEENWIIFEKNFDEVHENFLNRLKENHPALTSKDLRLCAYLRMKLSSKEIAPLLRISVRSVEISRYRLRRKLELSRDQNLSDYILLF